MVATDEIVITSSAKSPDKSVDLSMFGVLILGGLYSLDNRPT